jgi:site-specific recombinase XerC
MAHIVVDTGDELAVQFVGKGNKERECYVFNGALKALRAWLAVRGTAPGAVFCVIGKGGHIQHARHLSTTALHKRLTLRAAAAGVADVNWHDFRRTVAGDLLDSGADISVVAQLLGHASVTTTQRYDRRPAATRRAAASRVSVPY